MSETDQLLIDLEFLQDQIKRTSTVLGWKIQSCKHISDAMSTIESLQGQIAELEEGASKQQLVNLLIAAGEKIESLQATVKEQDARIAKALDHYETVFMGDFVCGETAKTMAGILAFPAPASPPESSDE